MSPSPISVAAIKAFRAQAGYSQVRFAEALGVSRRTVEEWEAGRSSPPAYLGLALTALSRELEPWQEPTEP